MSDNQQTCGCSTAIVQNVGVPGREFQETVLEPRQCRYPEALRWIEELGKENSDVRELERRSQEMDVDPAYLLSVAPLLKERDALRVAKEQAERERDEARKALRMVCESAVSYELRENLKATDYEHVPHSVMVKARAALGAKVEATAPPALPAASSQP